LPADCLVLELTESVFMRDVHSTVSRLTHLKRLGVQLAIDDFGTGYSSLDYLKRFPIDVIKVAKPFVDDVAKGREESALARAIIGLGDAFQLQTVAEGIEKPEQALRLNQMGCRLGQGFHYARPLESTRAGALLSEAA